MPDQALRVRVHHPDPEGLAIALGRLRRIVTDLQAAVPATTVQITAVADENPAHRQGWVGTLVNLAALIIICLAVARAAGLFG